jgi:hypothetical protein
MASYNFTAPEVPQNVGPQWEEVYEIHFKDGWQALEWLKEHEHLAEETLKMMIAIVRLFFKEALKKEDSTGDKPSDIVDLQAKLEEYEGRFRE